MNDFVYSKVIEWIPPGSRVLDLGSGDGGFLARLVQARSVRGEGVEKDPEMVARCVERGLIVHQGDILDGLDQYGDDSFDFILLLGTFQELLSPETVLRESFRVSRQVIVGYMNFAYWRSRLQLVFSGRSPRQTSNGAPWYESPNVQFFSVLDFEDFCEAKDIRRLRLACFSDRGSIGLLPNLRASEALVWLTLAPNSALNRKTAIESSVQSVTPDAAGRLP